MDSCLVGSSWDLASEFGSDLVSEWFRGYCLGSVFGALGRRVQFLKCPEFSSSATFAHLHFFKYYGRFGKSKVFL